EAQKVTAKTVHACAFENRLDGFGDRHDEFLHVRRERQSGVADGKRGEKDLLEIGNARDEHAYEGLFAVASEVATCEQRKLRARATGESAAAKARDRGKRGDHFDGAVVVWVGIDGGTRHAENGGRPREATHGLDRRVRGILLARRIELWKRLVAAQCGD